MYRTALLLALIPSGFFSCHKKPDPVPPPAIRAEAKADTLAASKAQAASDAVQAGRNANAANLDSPAKPATDGALSVAAANLPPPSPEGVRVQMEAVNLALAGKLEEAQTRWAKAEQDAAKLSQALADARQALENERKANAEALATYQREQAAKIAAAEAKAKNVVLAGQVKYLNIAGGLFALGFGLCAAFGGVVLLRGGAWVLLPLSLLAFGLAQIVGQWWFLWAVLAVILAAVGVFAYLAFKNKSATQALAVLRPVITTLDSAYDSAVPEVKSLLDEKVFDPLSKAMDKVEKATVHAVRAEGKKDAAL